MKKFFLVLSITAVFFSCKSKDGKTTENKETPIAVDSTLITDSSWGLINSRTTLESLKADYGSSNIMDTSICGPECADTLDVTVVYPNGPKEMVVYWKEGSYHKMVEMVESAQPGSPYHTASGIRIGSTLADVLKYNGDKLSFSGFGWDYGGNIGSYGNGKLANSRLNIHIDFAQHPAPDSLYGDRELNTDMPVVKNNMDKIVITDMRLSF